VQESAALNQKITKIKLYYNYILHTISYTIIVENLANLLETAVRHAEAKSLNAS